MNSFHKHDSGLLVAIAICLIGVAGSVGVLAAQAEGKRVPASPPACQDSEMLGLVRQSLDAGDKLRVIGLHSPHELRVSEGGDLRSCVVDVITDHGVRTTTFMIGWEDRAAGVPFVAGEPLMALP
ncbi:hypothetical protein [Minwuia thermotolerans]|uniref:Uncharacterized protein n=1 Tax=Minwuia thermotolerans TaxID=2056226 RepID=A0A2M9FWL1_9PROT|nr:hypothetical protein [Minwuia thermotolerans]PJK27858.1 hypothetical protein CVT23_20520 [Minwuia thermotolerans]